MSEIFTVWERVVGEGVDADGDGVENELLGTIRSTHLSSLIEAAGTK